MALNLKRVSKVLEKAVVQKTSGLTLKKKFAILRSPPSFTFMTNFGKFSRYLFQNFTKILHLNWKADAPVFAQNTLIIQVLGAERDAYFVSLF